MNFATEQSIRLVEESLQRAGAYRKVQDDLFVIKQGSAYVMIHVAPWGTDRALVRFSAQVVVGVQMTGELAQELLRRNAELNFGAFAYLADEKAVALTHTILGGYTLDPEEVLATAKELVLLADKTDDELMRSHGGKRMQDLLEVSVKGQKA